MARRATRAAARTDQGSARGASDALQPCVGLVGGDDVCGPGLFGTLLRAQSGLDGQEAGRQVVDAAAEPVSSGAGCSTVAAEG